MALSPLKDPKPKSKYNFVYQLSLRNGIMSGGLVPVGVFFLPQHFECQVSGKPFVCLKILTDKVGTVVT